MTSKLHITLIVLLLIGGCGIQKIEQGRSSGFFKEYNDNYWDRHMVESQILLLKIHYQYGKGFDFKGFNQTLSSIIYNTIIGYRKWVNLTKNKWVYNKKEIGFE